MWTIAEYQPTSLFSLRPYTATTSGGKSLIVPTPFAIKMALLDVAIRTQGLAQGQALFSALVALQIAVRLPERIVVNNTFVKIQRYNDSVSKGGAAAREERLAQAIAGGKWPYQPTIAFREYVQFAGPLRLAFGGMSPDVLAPLLVQINYLGKRGGFLQLRRRPEAVGTLPEGLTLLTQGVGDSFLLGTLQMVDDCGPSLTFERANVFEPGARIRPNQDRIFHHVVLPYKLAQSSKGYSLYRRIGS
jgi:hypothetical protein